MLIDIEGRKIVSCTEQMFDQQWKINTWYQTTLF